MSVPTADAAPRFHRLSAADLTNLAVEAPDTPMHVGVLAILDGAALFDHIGQVRLAEIRGSIERQLDAVPGLRQVVHRPGLFAGRPLWTDDVTFRIDRHVKQVELPPPHDEPALLELAESLMAPLLDRRHPMWRVWLITGMPDDQVALLVTLHHAIADGLAAIQLLTTLLDRSTSTAPAEHWTAMPPPGWAALARDNARVQFAVARRVVSAAHPARLASALATGWRALNQSWQAPRTSLNGPIGPRRRLDVLRVDLATAKRVAHAHGGKVNDVLLGIIGGGTRALLRARGEDTDQTVLHVAVAVSLRGPELAQPGNRSGIIVVKLPLGESDASARLRQVCAASALAKRSQVATTEQQALVWLARSGLMRLVTRHQHLTNVIESNVAGPPVPIHLLGAPVCDLIPIGALAGNLALSFLTLSYAGRLTITVRADADRFPELPLLLSAMAEEWRMLSQHVRV